MVDLTGTTERTDSAGGAGQARRPASFRRSRLAGLPHANPIFLREMREAMRTEAKSDPWRFKLLAFFGILGLIMYGASTAGVFHVSAPVVAFYVLALIEAVYVMRPADPTGVVIREKQQNTFETLLLTPLTPGRFMRGHLLFHLVLALRRIAVMLPLFGAVYILGGFTLGKFMAYQVLLLAYLLAANGTMMAVANAQPALAEGAAAMADRKGGKRQTPGANLNPAALLIYFLLPLVLILGPFLTGGPASMRHTILQSLLHAGTPSAPPVWDLVKFLALAHPFLTLLVWGDAMFFARPIPVWIVSAVFWLLVAQTAYFTFVHQIAVRKFRLDIGYRLGRWLLFSASLLGIAALTWRIPHLGAVACAVVTILYAVFRFANPMGVPVRERERWQLLPRRDIFIHRGGNLFAFLLAVLIPAWGIQALIVHRAALPGLGLASFYTNAAVFLAVSALLLGGQILRMRRLRLSSAESSKPSVPRQESGEQSADEKGTGKERSAGAPGNPAVAIAMALWLLPLTILVLEPLLRSTPAGPAAGIVVRLSEPVLLLNPFRFLYRLISANTHSLLTRNPLNLSAPAPLDGFGIVVPLNYYEVSLLAGAAVVAILMLIFAIRSRQMDRLPRAVPTELDPKT